MKQVLIDAATLARLIDLATSHLDDIESGLADGTYEKEENKSLPEDQEIVGSARKLLENESVTPGLQNFVDSVARMDIWGWANMNGPIHECEQPSDGFVDSHATLMGLIERARAINKSILSEPRKTCTPVKYWADYGDNSASMTHLFELEDQTATAGQAYITLSKPVPKDATEEQQEALYENYLSATMEINENPLSPGEFVPCLHLHFNGDELALSFFKVGKRFLVRPETDICISSFVENIHGRREYLYWVD